MIRWGCWAVVLCSLALPAGAQELAVNVARAPTAADRATLVTHGWPASREALAQALMKAYQPASSSGRPGSTGQAAFKSWLLLWQWCDLLSRNATPAATRDRPAAPLLLPLASVVRPDILAEWLADEELSRLLFANLSARDNAAAVLRILEQIRLAQPEKFREYRALALAIALVYDQPRPAFWPHAQVKPAAVPLRQPNPAEWFAYWTQQNEATGRLLDLRTLGPEQIKFVVDAPLDPAEFAWARANVRFARTDFAKAYDSVRYAYGRPDAGEYVWLGERYTLEEIKKTGGICVDQAYFAAIAGKARGLPTLLFVGQGTNGGHAWFAYMKSDDRWALDCGRSDNGYVIGEAFDPQTWQRISDHELAFLSERFRDRPEFAAAEADLLLARLFFAHGDEARAAKALDSALAVCPKDPAAWDAKADFLMITGAKSADLRAVHQAAVKQFATLPDLKAAHLLALADLAEKDGDTAEAARLRRQIVVQNRAERSDISVSLVAQRLKQLVNEGKLDEAYREYQRQLNALGKTGGGNLFYDVVEPFVGALLEAKDPARARDALRLARRALAPASGSVLDDDLRTLEASAASAASRSGGADNRGK